MNILLCCSAGMSTSLLVSKMQKAAADQNIEANIWAVASGAVKDDIEKADILLLGPQVRFMLNDMKKICDAKGIPIDVINMQQYGMCNGEAVLKSAMETLKK